MSLVDRIESAARLATQGEWRVMPDERGPFYIDSPQMDRMMSDICGCGDAEDAKYIALACPENVLKLCARVRELEEGLKEAVSALGVTFGTMHALYTKPEVCDLLVTLGAPRSAIDAAIGALPHFEAKLAALRSLLARGGK